MMATHVWNRAGVPVERGSTRQKVIFVRRRRHFSFFLGCLLAGASLGGVKLLWGTPSEFIAVLLVPFPTVISLLLFGDALRGVWSQRILVVDLGRRELVLVARSLRGTSSSVVAFSSLRGIVVGLAETEGPGVLLSIDGGQTILLGQDVEGRARPFARRIASLAGIPVQS
jgi:hypothetical protein